MTKRRLIFPLFLLAAPLFAVAAGAPTPGTGPGVTVRLAAAADLRFAFDRLIAEFHQSHSRTEITPVYGSSGTFALQIEQGAPFDLFFSADAELPARLAKAGRVRGQPFPYASGIIGLWVRKESKLELSRGLGVLNGKDVRRIAIANAKHAPYGRAAENALKKAGLLEELRPKLVVGDNIAQTAQFVASGAADVGLIARSLAWAPTMRERGRFQSLDAKLAPALRQEAVILKRASSPTECEAFRDFVRGSRGRAILEEFGLAPAE